MATVYLARDLRHDRRVAIKVLKPELGAVLGVDRFLAEIKVTANLQHPNLLPLFDSGEANGLLFYVMPFVEGESLRAKLDREQQLPIDEAVRIAMAVASALAYAHEHGVIHRDLKPENILLQSGQPVVADFGIALAVSNAGGGRVTQTGLSLGTPQYMSPEQAAGDRTIDGRSDIYSLAAVTYEMIAGEPPHTGPNAQAVISKLMTTSPQPLSALRSTAPGHVVAAVNVALAKLPADRFATAREFAEALGGTRQVALQPGVLAGATAPTGRFRRVREGVLAALALAGLAGTTYFATRDRGTAIAVGRFFAELPENVDFFGGAPPGVALSRDGTQLVVAGAKPGARGLYLRRLDDETVRFIAGTEDAVFPSVSFDGQSVLFNRDNQLRRVPITGGTSQVIADSAGGSPASWGENDQIIFVRSLELWLVAANGGAARKLAARDSTRGILGFSSPVMLPGGEHALATVYKDAVNAEGGVLGLVSLGDGSVTELGLRGSNPYYASSGHILFYRAYGEIYVAAFSLRRREVIGDAVRLVDGVGASSTGRADLAVSQTGVLAFHPNELVDGSASAMFVVDARGNERQVISNSGTVFGPRLSPDGRRVVSRDGPGAIGGDLWVHELETGARTKLTSNAQSWRPEWTADGARVVYMRGPDIGGRIMTRPWDASTDEAEVLPSALNGPQRVLQEISLGPPGTFAAIRTGSRASTGAADIWIAPIDSLSNLRPLLASPYFELEPTVSPDGRLLAFTSNESGRFEVYVTPLPGPGPRVPVSIGGGAEPRWSPNGASLFYRGATNMMSATISTSPALVVSRRDSLFVDTYRRYTGFAEYDVFPDGKRFLMTRVLGGARRSTRVVVIVNWPEMVGRVGRSAGQ